MKPELLNLIKRTNFAVKSQLQNFAKYMSPASLIIKSSTTNTEYYNAYAGSGDSGGPVVSRDSIVGVICGIYTPDVASGDIYNIISATSSRIAQDLINKKMKTVEIIGR